MTSTQHRSFESVDARPKIQRSHTKSFWRRNSTVLPLMVMFLGFSACAEAVPGSTPEPCPPTGTATPRTTVTAPPDDITPTDPTPDDETGEEPEEDTQEESRQGGRHILNLVIGLLINNKDIINLFIEIL